MTKLEIIAFYTQWAVDNSNRLIELSEVEFAVKEREELELTNDIIRGFVDKLEAMTEPVNGVEDDKL